VDAIKEDFSEEEIFLKVLCEVYLGGGTRAREVKSKV
jgi:hypothetical protein